MHRDGESPITAADAWFTGEDQDLRWTIYDLDPLTATSPPSVKDITGWSVQFRMAATATGPSVLTKSAVITSPTTGVCTVSVAAADTAAFTSATYHYTLARTDSGQNQVLAWGTAVLLGRVA